MKAAVIGIDLGTVNTCIATYDGEKVQIFKTASGRITPSYVYFDPKKSTIFYGDAAEKRALPNVIYDAKRFIGRRFNDPIVQQIYQNYRYSIKPGPDNNIYFDIPYSEGTVKKTPEEISAELLKYIKEQVCIKYDTDNVEAVITVPAHFNNNQREKTKWAALKAGIKVLKLMNEPTAAALSYFHGGFKKNLTAMVFDLGGGTFDISIININDEDITVRATDGDTFLGGRNFDENIMNHLKNNLENERGKTIGGLEKNRLKLVARKLKENLSIYDTTEETLTEFLDCDDIDFQLDRDTFNGINRVEFDRCLKIIEKCLTENNIRREEIDEVVMVGGSSRIVKIQEMVRDYFGKKKIMNNLDPDEAVAGGAAIQAYITAMKNETANSDVMSTNILNKLLIRDVNPLTLGVNISYKLMLPIIPRNSTLPATGTKKFLTFFDNQTNMTFQILEGERPDIRLNNLLGKLQIKNIPRKPAGQVSADVTFTINEDGILNVRASCGDQQEKLAIQLDQCNLCEDEGETKLIDIQNNDVYDAKFRKFVEAKKGLRKILKNHPNPKEFVNLLKDTNMEEQDKITRKLKEGRGSKLINELRSCWNEYLNAN